jgi:Uma2 family endonuclease
LFSTEQLLAMPEDGVERWLIRGQLRERPMTKRNRFHAEITAKISQLLLNWLAHQPQPRGKVYAGEAGCRLQRDPDTTFGIDVVYVTADIVSAIPEETTLIEGIPTLAVEILSPLDKKEEVDEKIDQYLQVGVPLIWIVDSHFQTVTVHRPGEEPELFNRSQELTGDPQLPGFRVAVADLFGE